MWFVNIFIKFVITAIMLLPNNKWMCCSHAAISDVRLQPRAGGDAEGLPVQHDGGLHTEARWGHVLCGSLSLLLCSIQTLFSALSILCSIRLVW